MRRLPFHPRRPGFTIVELLIVVTIMALLTALIVPALSGMARRQARLAADEVEDLLTMYAYRDSTSAQPIALWGGSVAGEGRGQRVSEAVEGRPAQQLGLWVLDSDPARPDDPAEWVQDRFSAPLQLIEDLAITDIRVDGRRQPLDEFMVTRQPSQPRPVIEFDLVGDGFDATLVLDPQALAPRRVTAGQPAPGFRSQIDLDRAGRDRQEW